MSTTKTRTKAEQGEATRANLIGVARELFATKGYADTSIEDITHRANVTRGALYHHFADKRELFMAVFEAVECDFGAKVAEAITGVAPERLLKVGLNAFLDVCLERDVQRIVLLDAPSVLGWEVWREVDAQFGIALTRSALEVAMEAGHIGRHDPEPLAHLVLGALNEAGLAIARADDVNAARRRFGKALEWWVDGLRPRP